MAAEILIYSDTSDHSTQDEITELLWKHNAPFYLTKKAEELEKKLKQKRYDLLILIFKQHVPYTLEAVISKNRNLSNLRRTQIVSIHQKYSDVEVQKALMLGIQEIFVEPCKKERILRLALESLDTPMSMEEQAKRRLYFEIGPIPCKIDVFGRIGKIFKNPIGNIQVETNLILDKNEEINIASRIANNIGHRRLKYNVLQSEGLDRYYNYDYSYILNLQSNTKIRESLFKWLKLNDREFTFPKTKLLWITDHLISKFETVLPKQLFSIYTISEMNFSYTRLEKLNPSIVVLEEKNERVIEILEAWEKEKGNHFKVIFNEYDRNHPSWEYLPNHSSEIFRQKFLTKVKDILKKRVALSIDEAKYMSRKSQFSRFAATMKGQIISTSGYQFKVELPHRISSGTIFRLHCPFLDDPSRSIIYARVITHHQYASSTVFTHECAIVPESNSPNQTLRELKILFDPKQKQKMDHLPKEENIENLHFMQKPEKKDKFPVIIFIGLGFGVFLGITMFIILLWSRS